MTESPLPFPLYGSVDHRTALLLSGPGELRAGIALASLLTHMGCQSEGLHTPPLVVANFGTAGANPQSWSIDEVLLINRVTKTDRRPYHPERFISWGGPETSCQTVDTPQTQAQDPNSQIFDMEAYGLTEAVVHFLSLAHIVIGKHILDTVGVDSPNWRALTHRSQAAYKKGAILFLQHALAHQDLLQQNKRRLDTGSISKTVTALVDQAHLTMQLTVTQERELTQHLRGCLAHDPSTVGLSQAFQRWFKELSTPIEGKPATKQRLAKLLKMS